MCDAKIKREKAVLDLLAENALIVSPFSNVTWDEDDRTSRGEINFTNVKSQIVKEKYITESILIVYKRDIGLKRIVRNRRKVANTFDEQLTDTVNDLFIVALVLCRFSYLSSAERTTTPTMENIQGVQKSDERAAENATDIFARCHEVTLDTIVFYSLYTVALIDIDVISDAASYSDPNAGIKSM